MRVSHLVTSALAVICLASAAEAQRVVYVLIGQSNTSYLWETSVLGTPYAYGGTVPTNVSYHLVADGPPSSLWPQGQLQLSPDFAAFVPALQPPVLRLGSRLGQAHSSSQVVLVMAARSGSALLERNEIGGSGYWVDDTDLLDTTALGRRMESVMQQLALMPGDELHFVWGQGETDTFPTSSITTQEYSDWAQILFAWLAISAGKADYDVHLVTLGALLSPAIAPDQMDVVRDAQFAMPGSTLVFPGLQPTIQPVAHHYDLPHSDPAHLSGFGYSTLADRIADGILFPATVPRLTAGPVSIDPNGFDIVIATTTPLTTMPLTSASNGLFEVQVAGTVVPSSGFQVGTNGNDVIVRILAGGLTQATSVSVGHVRGSGYLQNWDTLTPITGLASGMPLEPFRVP